MPDLMFVACDMGGLYRSTSGGASWEMIDGRQMKGSTRCRVAFHPTLPRTVYAYSPLRGVRRSTDGGATWPDVLVADPAGDLLVTSIALDRDLPDIIL